MRPSMCRSQRRRVRAVTRLRAGVGRRTWIWVGLGTLVGLALLASAYVAAVLWTSTRVPLNTAVEGLEISGMERSEADAYLSAELGRRELTTFRLSAAGTALDVRPKDAGLAVDVPATMDQVPGTGWNPTDLLTWFRGGSRIDAVVRVDATKMRSEVIRVAELVSVPPQEPRLAVVDQVVVVEPGENGLRIDEAGLSSLLIDAFLRPRSDIPVDVTASAPSVSPSAAEEARRGAQLLIDNPITIAAGATQARLPRQAAARALSFTSASGQVTPVVDGGLLLTVLLRNRPDFETPGRDATFRIRQGRPQVVPSESGTTLDAAALARSVAAAATKYPLGGVVQVPLVPLDPDLTTAEAAQLGVIDRLSRFTQNFPYAAYRVQNIGQAARYIDGTVLLPGETFSMNDTIKERTVANGYTVGFVIGPGGVFAEDLGGGVSAAATAMWTAAFYAGMERVETRAHSIYISRYAPGLEATVAWGVFDMRFRNDTPNAVFITAKTTDTSMKVAFWGTRQYDDIHAEFGPRMSVVPYTTIYDESSRCLGQSGVDGFSIDVDRVFVIAGQEVRRETIRTAYRPSPRVICRAPDPPSPPSNRS